MKCFTAPSSSLEAKKISRCSFTLNAGTVRRRTWLQSNSTSPKVLSVDNTTPGYGVVGGYSRVVKGQHEASISNWTRENFTDKNFSLPPHPLLFFFVFFCFFNRFQTIKNHSSYCHESRIQVRKLFSLFCWIYSLWFIFLNVEKAISIYPLLLTRLNNF